ncbi:conserved exported hypothetical protein [Vibrio harveyi]|uniref:hypothetical protein n=1 Tax=Vibrio harveyi TaxID=669 RepID=UPI002AD9BFD2|nr:hypothetical protein [Vibrio harveyi]CAK6712239.1 conserved exported hypothetical protein [Vibrio harveyi]
MISHTTKPSAFKSALSLFVLLMLQPCATATTISGQVKGDRLTWLNAYNQNGYLTSTNWQPLSGLQPTTEWVPGTFLGQSASTITLRNEETGESLALGFQVLGIQYNLGKASGHFNSSEPVKGSYKVCETMVDEGGIITLADMGKGFCINKNTYEAATAFTPFQFARPLMKTSEIAQALRTAGVSSGQYTGSIMVRPAYGFRSPTGSWTYRSTNGVPITLSIRYEAANLANIEVSGSGAIPAKYNQKKLTVSGQAGYLITAHGFFANGLKLSFPENESDSFNLTHIDEGDAKPIPYSIDCSACEDTSLVSNGKLSLLSRETVVNGTGNTISLMLNVHYDNIPADDLTTGNYNDQFTVYFEENL